MQKTLNYLVRQVVSSRWNFFFPSVSNSTGGKCNDSNICSLVKREVQIFQQKQCSVEIINNACLTGPGVITSYN